MPNLFEPHIIQIQPRSSATLPRQRHERGDLLAVVLRIIHQIAQITDIDTLLESAAAEIARAFDYPSVGLLLADGDVLVGRAAAGADARLAPQHLIARTSPAAMAYTHARAMFSTDLSDSAVSTSCPSARYACAALPLLVGGSAIGVLELRSDQPNRWRGAECEALLALADQLALLIDSARRHRRELDQMAAALAEAQERTLQAEKLRAIGELASGVAHDFNNQLAIILGHMELVKTPSSPYFERSRRAIIQAAQDGAQTVQRIQAYVRTRPEQYTASVDLAELAEDVVSLTRPRWHADNLARGVTVTVACALGAVPPVLGNAAELREIVTNLILNAVDAMPQGGHLNIATGVAGEIAWLEVRDTGHGISAEVRARIFEPFYTTKANRGTGLGLAVSRSIALRHNGDLTVQSTPGQGSCFRLELPVAAQLPAPQPAPPAPALSQITPLRILLVEDDQAVRETLTQLLKLDDHTVTACGDAHTALAQLRAGTFDVICFDLGLPGMTGWELLRQARAITTELTTVLISGWGAQIDLDQARARQIDFVVPKPIDLDALARALSAAAERVLARGSEA
ncbi:MAG: ATP-binding protein [Kouleothrix sp.]